ncbi:MAG TPA: response regulator [Planctomycetota bacterium]|nr:response regulator [Planctomycetota bacterium]
MRGSIDARGVRHVRVLGSARRDPDGGGPPRPERRPDEPAPVAAEPVGTPARTALVVMIEDDASLLAPVQALVAEALGAGTRVVQQRFGVSGLAAVLERRPDLVLLDLRLPDIDGLSLLKLMKANPEARQVPVVIMTGHAAWNMIEIALDAGAAGYFFKPLDPEPFIASLRGLLGPGRA